MQARQQIPLIFLFLLSMTLVAGLAACNTISGVGKDLEAAGSGIEEAAEEEKRY
ncbi:entericidin A/B family lipoprotein [Thiococcus pfennigii]|uniref:entericidin A/B family lipoprotein n=1 Tax=Thiococcus pfennigii TaxID=1057 RepID=UPI001905F280|nr:entericidin A/B family lipoprotein [Thiococcus pfennigii]MBK1733582.1 Entericidin EcnAB [Thiococcus pfennigii]